MKLGSRVGVLLVGVVAALLLVGPGRATSTVPAPQFNCVADQTVTFANATDVAIPDPPDGITPAAPARSTIVVTGLTGTVYDVDVTTQIPHTAVGDLLITLSSPSGRTIELSAANGSLTSNAFNGTTWDDDADPDGLSTAATNNGLVTDHNYVDGVVASPLVPQEALATFMGSVPNGVWTLSVEDLTAGDTGLIDDWSLSVTPDRTSRVSTVSSELVPGLVVPNGGTVSTTVALPANAGTSSIRSTVLSTQGFSYTGLGDLTLTLQSPAGTIVTYTSGNGGPFDLASRNMDWNLPLGTFPGRGPDPISRIDFTAVPAPFLFVVSPEESSGAFVGEDPAGVWTLTATDAGALAGGGVIGSVMLTAERSGCVGAVDFVSATGPPAGVPIGTPVTYEAVVKNTGIGKAHDFSLDLTILSGFRITAVDSTSEGTCTAATGVALPPAVKFSLAPVQCSWASPMLPGAERRLRITGEASYAAALSAFASVRVSPSPQNAPPINLGPTFSSRTIGPVRFAASTRLASNGRPCTALGTDGDDNLSALGFGAISPGPQVYCGLAGDDRITGSDAGEVMDGGPGNDALLGGLGDDRMDGGAGTDFIAGARGADDVRGGAGADTLRGGEGPDRLAGGPGADLLEGEGGPDTLIGGPGADKLRGSAGTDLLFGGLGSDLLDGGPGIDTGRKGAGDTRVRVELPR